MPDVSLPPHADPVAEIRRFDEGGVARFETRTLPAPNGDLRVDLDDQMLLNRTDRDAALDNKRSKLFYVDMGYDNGRYLSKPSPHNFLKTPVDARRFGAKIALGREKEIGPKKERA